jgi:phytoene dehydrogenase-like protein
MLPGASLLKNFSGDRARALVAGCMAHSFLPLDRAFTSAFGLLLLVGAHKFGWPFAVGGSQAIADALASYLRSLGGEIETGRRVNSLGELPEAKVLMCDLTPRGLAALAGTRLSPRQHRRYQAFRHGPAAFKLDYALSRPVPWINRELSAAGTIHLGGRAEDVASAEAATWHGHLPQRLFILIAQPSLFDETRAPEGRHTLWAYAHVPHGSQIDSTALIESQIEELAPGFRESVLDRCVSTPADLEAYNPNLVGGDITGGAHTLKQLLFRPFPAINPYATPIAGVYLCSSSTPPGAGVHGMCGYWAARAALRNELR